MSKLDDFKETLGELARPFAIYAVTIATAKAIWCASGADVIGASGLLLGALAGTKTYENIQVAKANASANTSTPPP